MQISFLCSIPFTLGLVIAYLVKIFTGVRFAAMFGYSFLIMCFIILFSYAVLGEGIICIIMAFPFILMAYLPGCILGWNLARLYRQANGKILSVLLITPLFLGAFEQNTTPATKMGSVVKSIFIEAAPKDVWEEIRNPGKIDAEEIHSAYLYKIGMPKPVHAYTTEKDGETIRASFWEKGVRFDEKIIEQQEERRITWSYLFTDKSFPKGSLDDHIKIGGRYFDLSRTAYTLIPADNGTILRLETNYRVNTHFNWYANLWAQLFIRDVSEGLLTFYKTRLESPV